MEGHAKVFLLLYNGQPTYFELPKEDAAKFSALETLCKSLFPFSFKQLTLLLLPTNFSLHLSLRNVIDSISSLPL
jgi:hypothetical protein